MKLLVQWTKLDPTDWHEIDLTPTGRGARAWRDLPAKPEPTGSETLDNAPGWVWGVCVQGMALEGFDHYAAEPITNGIRVLVWSDDAQDHPFPWGHVWELRAGWVDRTTPDGSIRHEGPDQTLTVYTSAQDRRFDEPLECGGRLVQVRPWSEFPTPAETVTRHGISVSDDLAAQHLAARAHHGWEEWLG